MPENVEPPLQVECTCRCRDEKAAFSPADESRDEALQQHKGNYIKLVTNRLPYLAWIYSCLRRRPPDRFKTGHRISIAEMHRMHMRVLQIELVKIGIALQFNSSDENARKNAQENLEPALMKYSTDGFTPNIDEKLTNANIAQAVRDYEYMTTTVKEYDYFIVSSERLNDGAVITNAMKHQKLFESRMLLYEQQKNYALPTGPWEKRDENNRGKPIGGTRNGKIKSTILHNFWLKLGTAIVGAGFLIGPMWLLALRQALYLQLEATTGFVFGFGLVLACSVDKIDQVFAGTLAYAAVLMVFVGLSIQGAHVPP